MNFGWMLHDHALVRTALRPTQLKKIGFFLLADSAIISIAFFASFLIRFDFAIPDLYFRVLIAALPLFLVTKMLAFAYFHLYKLSWRFVGLSDLYNVLKGVASSSALLVGVIYFLRIEVFASFPRGVLLIDAVMTLVLIAALRVSKRVVLDVARGTNESDARRTLVLGAGNTGEMILRDIRKSGVSGYQLVGILDDDPNVVGTYVHGMRVLGGLRMLEQVIRTHEVRAVIIAIPSLKHLRLRQLHATAHAAGVREIKIVPRLYDVHHPQVRLKSLEDLKIEDLIGRQAVRVDYRGIGKALAGKTILVTGAAGSIGSEIVRQVCRFHPKRLICFEVDETELYDLERSIRREFPSIANRLSFVIGDVRDVERVGWTFETFRPNVVFHAAAYKHVPMMEENPSEAVKVNIVGTYIVARAARATGVERFTLISTDKAVRPTSVMGATKRIAEYIVQALSQGGKTAFVAVRFGNVLGSRGSVLPIFLEQIRRGGPLTITHHEMKRYFMTIPEAVSLVLQASVIGDGGDVLVLDMGDPVRILELAEELLKLHQLLPHEDIAIEYIGMRPGEKLFEELLTAEEGTKATLHEKVFCARGENVLSIEDVRTIVQQFMNLARFPDADGRAIRQLLRQHIRWYEEDEATPVMQQRAASKQEHERERVFG
jgi:FlaA1/EpsC-like NDP-sugar epimerase